MALARAQVLAKGFELARIVHRVGGGLPRETPEQAEGDGSVFARPFARSGGPERASSRVGSGLPAVPLSMAGGGGPPRDIPRAGGVVPEWALHFAGGSLPVWA